MLYFMTSINKSFLLKESIINIAKTIRYEKYSIVPQMVKIQEPHLKKSNHCCITSIYTPIKTDGLLTE